MMRMIAGLALLACAAAPAWAVEVPNYTPEERKRLPPQARQPAENRVSVGGEVTYRERVAAYLYTLRFLERPVVADAATVRAAVEAFQRHLDAEPTGRLLLWQYRLLEERVRLVRGEPVFMPKKTFFDFQDKLTVRGTWTLEGEAAASPLQTSAITCREATMECVESRARIARGVLHVLRDRYRIEEWGSRIRAVSRAEGGQCYTWTLTVDRDALEARAEGSKARDAGTCSRAPQQRTRVMSDGAGIARRYHAERLRKAAEAINPEAAGEWRRYLQALGIAPDGS